MYRVMACMFVLLGEMSTNYVQELSSDFKRSPLRERGAKQSIFRYAMI